MQPLGWAGWDRAGEEDVLPPLSPAREQSWASAVVVWGPGMERTNGSDAWRLARTALYVVDCRHRCSSPPFHASAFSAFSVLAIACVGSGGWGSGGGGQHARAVSPMGRHPCRGRLHACAMHVDRPRASSCRHVAL